MNEARWRKSSYSGPQNNCVEVATVRTAVGVRDTKDRAGGRLDIEPDAWSAFVAQLAK